MRKMKAAQVAQLDPLELLPKIFVRIQVWGIGWQALPMPPRRGAVGEERLDGLAAVDRRAIPDDDHPARDLAPQVLQKGDHIR